jgi:short-chain fatty acids transporter
VPYSLVIAREGVPEGTVILNDWAAAQLQANPASLPPTVLAITGVIPFTETILLWQSMLLTAILIAVSVAIAWWSAPRGDAVRDAAACGIEPETVVAGQKRGPRRPGEWLEYSPLVSLALAALGIAWLGREFAGKGFASAISNLNTYNFLFLVAGLLLHWRPRRFLDAVARAVPATTGVLIQFPLYGGIAGILTGAKGGDGQTLTHHLSSMFVGLASKDTFAPVIGI